MCVCVCVQRKMKEVMDNEEKSKELAKTLLDRAKRETGVQKPEDNPELISSFAHFPDKIDDIEELLHDYHAQAEISAGTDTQVMGRSL